MIAAGRSFYKMSGSGNDFVFVDAREGDVDDLDRPEWIQAACARGTGIGADGVVFLKRSAAATFRIKYLNSDGSLAALCGNATLCGARLAVELGAAHRSGFTIETDAGILAGRYVDDQPEIDLEPVSEVVAADRRIDLAAGESHAGYALVGVPHVVIRVDDLDRVDVVDRGRPIRRSPSFRHGANVNFVAPASAQTWRMRTYERGVEAETLACGTGAVATALLLETWGEVTPGSRVSIETRSGQMLHVRLSRTGTAWQPSLSGSARIVFVGAVSEL